MKSIILLMLIITTTISWENFQILDQDIQSKQFYGFSYPYIIYQVTQQNSKFMYLFQLQTFIQNSTQSDSLSKLPKYLGLSNNQTIYQQLIKISFNYFVIVQAALGTNNEQQRKQIKNCEFTINNYIYYKKNIYNESESDQIKLEYLISVGKKNKIYQVTSNDIWNLATNFTTGRFIVVRNQTNCFNQIRSNEDQIQSSNNQCFAVEMQDIGVLHQLHHTKYKLYKEYVGLTHVKFLQIQTFINGSYLIVLGDQKKINNYICQDHYIKFNKMKEIERDHEVNYLNTFLLSDKNQVFVFSNSTIKIESTMPGHENQTKQYHGEDINYCEKLSQNHFGCLQANLYKIFNSNCQVVDNIVLNSTQQNLKIRVVQHPIDIKIIQYYLLYRDSNNLWVKKSLPYSIGIQKTITNIYEVSQNLYRQEYIYSSQQFKNKRNFAQAKGKQVLSEILQLIGIEDQDNKEACKIISQIGQNGKQLLLSVNFTSQQWRICKLSFNQSQPIQIFANIENLQQEKQAGYTPLKVFVCVMDDHSDLQTCYFKQTSAKGISMLFKNTFYQVYIINEDQRKISYNLKIKYFDLDLGKVVVLFFIIVAIVFLASILSIVIVLLRSTTYNVLIYFDIINVQPEYTYPLGYFSLKIKIKKLVSKGYLSYKTKKIDIISANSFITTEQQFENCCFCLQQIQHGNQIIQQYCKHEFHASCYENWLRSQANNRCPICKRNCSEEDYSNYKILNA